MTDKISENGLKTQETAIISTCWNDRLPLFFQVLWPCCENAMRGSLLRTCGRVCLVLGSFTAMGVSVYSGRVDIRLVLFLGRKRATKTGVKIELGLNDRAVTYLIRGCRDAGLVRVWYKGHPLGRVACLSLTPEGKKRAAELALELGEDGVAKLLAPRSRNGRIITNGKAVKGKRAAKPDSLGNTLGL